MEDHFKMAALFWFIYIISSILIISWNITPLNVYTRHQSIKRKRFLYLLHKPSGYCRKIKLRHMKWGILCCVRNNRKIRKFPFKKALGIFPRQNGQSFWRLCIMVKGITGELFVEACSYTKSILYINFGLQCKATCMSLTCYNVFDRGFIVCYAVND